MKILFSRCQQLLWATGLLLVICLYSGVSPGCSEAIQPFPLLHADNSTHEIMLELPAGDKVMAGWMDQSRKILILLQRGEYSLLWQGESTDDSLPVDARNQDRVAREYLQTIIAWLPDAAFLLSADQTLLYRVELSRRRRGGYQTRCLKVHPHGVLWDGQRLLSIQKSKTGVFTLEVWDPDFRHLHSYTLDLPATRDVQLSQIKKSRLWIRLDQETRILDLQSEASQ